MAQSNEARRLARAVRDHTLYAHETLTPRVRKAVVKQTGPLEAVLTDADVVLDSDEILLGSWLRYYDRVYGIVEGDTLFVMPLRDGDWLALELASDEDMEEGIGSVDEVTASGNPVYSGSDPQGGTVTVTPNRNIVKKVPFYDATGAVIGVIPIYASLP